MKDIKIDSLDVLKVNVRPCMHIKVHKWFGTSRFRMFGYFHHMFVDQANNEKCVFFHYKSQSSLKPSKWGKISKDEIIYAEYNHNEKMQQIINFKNGDLNFLVARPDYPTSDTERNIVQMRANERLGEMNYCAYSNNCESYVNWIFTGRNISDQVRTSSKHAIVADGIDSFIRSSNILQVINTDANKIELCIKAALQKGKQAAKKIQSERVIDHSAVIGQCVFPPALPESTDNAMTSLKLFGQKALCSKLGEDKLLDSLLFCLDKKTPGRSVQPVANQWGEIVIEQAQQIFYSSEGRKMIRTNLQQTTSEFKNNTVLDTLAKNTCQTISGFVKNTINCTLQSLVTDSSEETCKRITEQVSEQTTEITFDRANEMKMFLSVNEKGQETIRTIIERFSIKTNKTYAVNEMGEKTGTIITITKKISKNTAGVTSVQTDQTVDAKMTQPDVCVNKSVWTLNQSTVIETVKDSMKKPLKSIPIYSTTNVFGRYSCNIISEKESIKRTVDSIIKQASRTDIPRNLFYKRTSIFGQNAGSSFQFPSTQFGHETGNIVFNNVSLATGAINRDYFENTLPSVFYGVDEFGYIKATSDSMKRIGDVIVGDIDKFRQPVINPKTDSRLDINVAARSFKANCTVVEKTTNASSRNTTVLSGTTKPLKCLAQLKEVSLNKLKYAFACAFIYLIHKVYKICKNSEKCRRDKFREIFKEVITLFCSVPANAYGEIIGQSVIPYSLPLAFIPLIGRYCPSVSIGRYFGSIITAKTAVIICGIISGQVFDYIDKAFN